MGQLQCSFRLPLTTSNRDQAYICTLIVSFYQKQILLNNFVMLRGNEFVLSQYIIMAM